MAAPAAAVTAAPRRGRPRSEEAERAVLDAALDLLAEHGYAGLTMEAVAARAGVAKTTVYRRWAGKDEVLIDALNLVKGGSSELPGDSVAGDLKVLMERMRRSWLHTQHGRIMRRLAAEGNDQPELYRMFCERVVEPRRAVTRAIIRRGIDEGSIRPDIDVEAVIGLLASPVIVGVMTHREAHLTREHVEFVVDTVLAGLKP
jgi:AcrR family transcriptional regulator